MTQPITDANEALMAKQEMWTRLGRACADRALKEVEKSAFETAPLRWARAAEACFWQATGEAEAIDVEDVL